MILEEIDWNKMWKDALKTAAWGERVCSWNERARRFSEWVNADWRRADKDDYINQLLSRIKVDPNCTVLDIGSEPGTLTIPMAKKAKSVTAVDISGEMLRYARENAAKAGLDNVRCVNKAWEDVIVGEDIETHDIAIASRSLVMLDLKETLSKVDSVARRAVYLTYPIVHFSFDEEVCKAVGREFKQFPSYIYVYNILYQMGIYAGVEFIDYKIRICYSSLDEAITDWRWRMGQLTSAEEEKLRACLLEQL